MVSEGGAVFFLALALYLVIGVLLDFHFKTFQDDAFSREANGFYVLYSLDPHLSAMGFVWNPGMSVADLVPLLFYPLWPPLATHIFAASLASALFMAGAVYQVYWTLREWGVGRPVRLVLLVVMALNPMILYYAGNGMSEGLYLFTLVATSRYLLRWLREDDLRSLVYAGTALGFCYLVRNEAAAAALLAGAVVVTVRFLREMPPSGKKVWSALTDLTIFEIPFILAFAGWAVCSYVITGQPFAQFTSIYGNSSQERFVKHQLFHGRIVTDVHAVLYLAPLMPVIAIAAVVVAFRKRDLGVLAPITVIGGGLAFDLLSYAAGSIEPFLRYFITAVPLDVLLVGSLFAKSPATVRPCEHKPIRPGRSRRGWLFTAVAAIVACILLLPSIATTVRGMSDPVLATEETQLLGFIFHKHQTAEDRQERLQYSSMQAISNDLSRYHFGDGQVIVDNFAGCIPYVILMSPNPRIFVIPNDRQFQRILADPLTFGVHYILDNDPSSTGSLAATNIAYPGLWKSGAGFAHEVRDIPASGQCPQFKLYRVVRHPNQVAG